MQQQPDGSEQPPIGQMQQLQIGQGPQMPFQAGSSGPRQPHPRGLLQFLPSQAAPNLQALQPETFGLVQPAQEIFPGRGRGLRAAILQQQGMRPPMQTSLVARGQGPQQLLGQFPPLQQQQLGPRNCLPQPQQNSPRIQAPQQTSPGVQKTGSVRAQAPQQKQQQQTSQKKPEGQQSTFGINANRKGAQAGALRPPPRPGAGTVGRPISLSANHFALTVKCTTLYHYDAEIKPEVPKALFK